MSTPTPTPAPAPAEESTSPVRHHHDDSRDNETGATHTMLSILGETTSRDGQPSSTAANVIGTAHNMFHRITSSVSAHTGHPTQSPEDLIDHAAASAAPTVMGAAQNAFSKLTHAAHNVTSHATEGFAHPTQSPEDLIDRAAASAEPTVLGAAQTAFSRLTDAAHNVTHHSTPRTAPAHHTRRPVVDVPKEHPADSYSLTEHEERAVTPPPPRGFARVTRLFPALPDPAHEQRTTRVSHSQRRVNGNQSNMEATWRKYDERDNHREKSVGDRVDPTIDAARQELVKATEKARLTGWAQNVALALQVLIGALTTALGAALSGKNTSVAISLLGGTSTLVASYLARTKGLNEPETSKFRAKALDHFLREIEAFDLDHGHEMGHKWDDKINGFRLGLERILGNHAGSVTVRPESADTNQEKWGALSDPNIGPNGNGNGKYPMTGSNSTRPGYMTV